MSAKRSLGRGFDSLIPTELLDESFDPTADQDGKVSDLRNIKLDEITTDPDQPRRKFDDKSLEELAESIRLHGILQPIVVTPRAGGYQIVAGERRYRAARMAGLDRIPALVRTVSGQHKLELSLIENLQRRNLNAIETATAYLKLRDQFNMTLSQIGERMGGRSISAISNTLQLLRLSDALKQAVVDGKISEGQARPLINVDPGLAEDILPTIIAESWSARRIEQFVVQVKKGEVQTKKTNKSSAASTQPYASELAQFEKRFASQVAIRTNAKGAGRIVISFKDEGDFQRISKLLGD